MDWHTTAASTNGNEGMPSGLPYFQSSSDIPSLPRASLSSSDALPTAGSQLSQMMDLSAARPPQATQDELRTILQRFSRRRTPLRDTFFYAHGELVESISRVLAGQVPGPSQAGEIYVGVQRLSRAASQMPRYRALAQSARHVYLYGIHDLRDPAEKAGFSRAPFVTLVLDRSRPTSLEWFWFMVMNVPGFQTALVAEQVEDTLWSDSQQTRLYKCLWTFNSAQVQQIVDILRQAARILWW